MNNTQKEIDKLKYKIYRGCLLEEKLLDALFGFFIFVIIFGIGFTCGYYAK